MSVNFRAFGINIVAPLKKFTDKNLQNNSCGYLLPAAAYEMFDAARPAVVLLEGLPKCTDIAELEGPQCEHHY